MNQPSDPAERLAREIARESLYLPERWRLWLYERLREHLAEVDLEKHQIDVISAKMSAAISSLERVAAHLELKDKKARLRLTIPQFDSAPESVREGWRGHQVAKVMLGSWDLAKGVAFTDQRLPVAAEVKRKRAESLTRKRRESKFTLNGVKAWLDTRPKKKTRNAYDAWAKSRNQELKAGEKRIPLGRTLWLRWRVPLTETIKAVEEDRIPGEESGRSASQLEETRATARPVPNRQYAFQAQVIRPAREARGLSIQKFADETGIGASQLGKIEKGLVHNPTFETLTKLANALNLSLEELAVSPSSD